jgi:S1-C subfamily serine protease
MRLLTIIALLFTTTTTITADELDSKLHSILYPIVRVTYQGGGGSGTVVYSEDRESSGEFQTFVLTNHHVVSRAIKVEKIWDNLKQAYEYKENNDLVEVEIFNYANGGRTVTKSPVKAEIVAYQADEDIALLKLKYPFELKHSISILPSNKPLRLFQEIYAAGCPLLVDPTFTKGEVTDLEVIIDKKIYIGGSADIIWGNSGGAVFVNVDGTYYFVGIPSRGMSVYGQAVTYLGYFVSPERVHKFVRTQKLDFLLNKDKTPTESFEERAKLRTRGNIKES